MYPIFSKLEDFVNHIFFSNNLIIRSQVTVSRYLSNNPKIVDMATGKIGVYQNNNYEFWVMTHSIQKLNTQKFINNFQVAIRHKTSNLFVHALSDSSFNPEKCPKHARISLVDYQQGTFLEKGKLCFECMNLD